MADIIATTQTIRQARISAIVWAAIAGSIFFI